MPPLRFLHTADIHLGKPFGGYEAADRLRVARTEVIARLIAAATQAGAAHILVAGDLFETPNPAAQTWRQMAARMAEAEALTWWLLPGNHDNLREAGATWGALSALGHANIRCLTEPAPVEMQTGAMLLPAPLASRHPTEDPTAWMDGAETPDGVMRIGLAHGSIRGFSEGEMPADVIAADRDSRARLDFLALGDWHGSLKVSERMAYAGAPERTGFQHDGRGTCLLVEIDGPGAMPTVETLDIGIFDWRRLTLDLVPGDDAPALLKAALPEGPRRETLLRVSARGRASLVESSALAAYAESIAPEFCHFKLDTEGLGTEIDPRDLDEISLGGALRAASDALAAEAADVSLSEVDRRIAEAALRRLHSLATEDGA